MDIKFWTWFWKTFYPWVTDKFVPWMAGTIAAAVNKGNGSIQPLDKPGVPPPPPDPPNPPR